MDLAHGRALAVLAALCAAACGVTSALADVNAPVYVRSFTNPGNLPVRPIRPRASPSIRRETSSSPNRGNNRIDKFDRDGNHLLSFGAPGTGPGQFADPGDVGVDAAGNIYVLDEGNVRVQKFDSNGGFTRMWGSFGSLPGEVDSARGLWVDPDGSVWVADRGNNRIQKFDSNGALQFTWGTLGAAPGQFDDPRDLARDTQGDIFVLDGRCRARDMQLRGISWQKTPSVL